MSSPPKPRPTFDELYARIERLPEGITGEILTPGVLTTMSRPAPSHQHAMHMIHRTVDPFDPRLGGRGWWIFSEVEIRLPGDRLAVPDLSGWRVERVARLPETNPIVIVPDWCAEILSPSSASQDRGVKLSLYAKCGVGHVWMVDPALRLVEVYETARERPTLVATARDAEAVVLPPFEGEIAVAPWWYDAPAAPQP